MSQIIYHSIVCALCIRVDFKVRGNACKCVYLRVSEKPYLSLPLQVRLSGCSFMRWGQAQEKVWLKLMRQRWEQGPLPSLVAHGLGAEGEKKSWWKCGEREKDTQDGRGNVAYERHRERRHFRGGLKYVLQTAVNMIFSKQPIHSSFRLSQEFQCEMQFPECHSQELFSHFPGCNGPLHQWTLKQTESAETDFVYQTCQHSLLPHHCHEHWLRLSINNSVRSLFSCLQLQDPVPLCYPHTLGTP